MSESARLPPTSQQLQALLDKLRHQQFMEEFMKPPLAAECTAHDDASTEHPCPDLPAPARQ